MMWVECCGRCKKATISSDHVARKKRCSACGLESDYDSIEDGDDVVKNDTVCLGDLTNPLLSKSGHSIVTTEPKNDPSDDFLSLTSGNSENRGSDSVSITTTEMNSASPDDVIISIAAMSDSLDLSPAVKNQANEIFKEVEAYHNKGKPQNALFAGCIYIACRVSEMTRSMEEISSVANGATIPEILQAIELVVGKLNMNTNLLMDIKPVDFIKRFCSNLGMDSREVKAVQIAAGSYECGDRSPVLVAAGFVYAFAGFSYAKKLLKEVGEATGVSAQTLVETYHDLRPYLSTVLAKMDAKAKDPNNT